MNVSIVTPDENKFQGEAEAIVVPGSDGLIGILNDHAPLISSLKPGIVKLTTTEGEKSFEINGGVVEVLKNEVIILAE